MTIIAHLLSGQVISVAFRKDEDLPKPSWASESPLNKGHVFIHHEVIADLEPRAAMVVFGVQPAAGFKKRLADSGIALYRRHIDDVQPLAFGWVGAYPVVAPDHGPRPAVEILPMRYVSNDLDSLEPGESRRTGGLGGHAFRLRQGWLAGKRVSQV